ncbi:MAG: hypothetical protein ACRCX2_17240, partial [Paraclostridium sp.]
MEITKWNETSIEVKPDGNTNLYSKNFFSAKDEKGVEVKKYKIAIKGSLVEVDFCSRIGAVKVNGVWIKRINNIKKNASDEVEFEIDKVLESYEVEVPDDYLLENKDDGLSIVNNSLEDKEFEIIIKTY